MPTALFIDSMGLVFRAYHAMSKSGFKAPNGEPTGAVFGFANMITAILDAEKPDFIAAAFDTSAPTFRHDKYDGYKAHRATTSDRKRNQRGASPKFYAREQYPARAR
jgi:DNA polymerase-1